MSQARRRPPLTCARASTETVQSTGTQEDDEDDEDLDIQIEGLTEDYCDDFVCTSSPAVEQTLRSLAKDLVRRKWTAILFAKDVKYRVRAVFVVCAATAVILLLNANPSGAYVACNRKPHYLNTYAGLLQKVQWGGAT